MRLYPQHMNVTINKALCYDDKCLAQFCIFAHMGQPCFVKEKRQHRQKQVKQYLCYRSTLATSM